MLTEGTYSLFQALAMGWDIKRRSWWEPELELVDRVVREGDTAIDVGANYGLWAYHLSRAVGPTGKVYSFEPLPFTARTFRLIGRALGFLDNVELVNKGCGEAAGRVEFTVPVQEGVAISAGLVHMVGRHDARPGKEKHAAFDKTKNVECEVVALDEHLPNVERVSLLKCDIEGADLYAMRGARRLLEKHKPVVIIEITPWFLEGFGFTVADVYGFFEELGYACYRYDEGGRLVPTPASEIVEDNWVFVHPENASRVQGLLPPQA
ncbi:MAG: FkbM family methyltransferase [Labilithrix sp.]|nr:FkbM family methyltransferase [Labilithrix sp.]MCW5833652.1 FkbM family methyltransferase [Labilithrix sp.]